MVSNAVEMSFLCDSKPELLSVRVLAHAADDKLVVQSSIDDASMEQYHSRSTENETDGSHMCDSIRC